MRARVKTGIEGIDRLLFGGIPEGNQVVLAGGPGAGKTLACFEFLYKNALLGHTGIFFTLEEKPETIIENAKDAFTDFKDIDELIANKKIIINGSNVMTNLKGSGESEPRYAFTETIAAIQSLVESTGATRVVIDSVSIVSLLIKDPFIYRTLSISLVTVLRDLKVTSLLTMEIETPEKNKLIFLPEFFIYDGIMTMYESGSGGSRTPALEIIKMRGSKHSFSTVPYEITPSGINLLTTETYKDESDQAF